MHMPERWGYVQFSSAVQPSRTEAFIENPDEPVKRLGASTSLLPPDRVPEREWPLRPDARATRGGPVTVQIRCAAPRHGRLVRATTAPSPSGTNISLRQDGRVWRTESRK